MAVDCVDITCSFFAVFIPQKYVSIPVQILEKKQAVAVLVAQKRAKPICKICFSWGIWILGVK